MAECFFFGLRSGTRLGIEEHVLKVETHRDLSNWTLALIQGTNSAVELVRELSTGEENRLVKFKPIVKSENGTRGCIEIIFIKLMRNRLNVHFSAVTWNGLSCRLVLHYDNGFTLFGMAPPQTLNQNHDLPQKSSVFLWHYSFEQLKSSADDGIRMLLLHFSDDRGVVSSTASAE